MDISQAVAVRFWWNLYKMEFNTSVWLSAKLSFWKICGAENDPRQGFARLSYFSRKRKFIEKRRVNLSYRVVFVTRWGRVFREGLVTREGKLAKGWLYKPLARWPWLTVHRAPASRRFSKLLAICDAKHFHVKWLAPIQLHVPQRVLQAFGKMKR